MPGKRKAGAWPRLAPAQAAKRDALAGRLLGSFMQTMEVFTIHLGQRLGFYEALRQGPATPQQLARRTGTDRRYAQEWLEQQAVAGFLEASGQKDPARRTYSLPAAHADTLLNEESGSYLGFAPRMAAAVASQLPALQRAFRSGAGVPWESYGPDMWAAQAGQNRGFLLGTFGPAILPSLPHIDARLRADPPARVADLACGVGWASIALARQYPKVRVDGLDLDAAAVRHGRKLVREQGLGSRIHLQVRDAAEPALRGQYDFVVMVEALHDLSKPVEVLRAARRLLAPGGRMLVVDENVQESFAAPGPDLERVFYGFSVLACLPNGRAESPSAATGTVMRPATVHRYAKAAGFRASSVLPVQHDFFRFYELLP